MHQYIPDEMCLRPLNTFFLHLFLAQVLWRRRTRKQTFRSREPAHIPRDQRKKKSELSSLQNVRILENSTAHMVRDHPMGHDCPPSHRQKKRLLQGRPQSCVM